MKNSITFLSLLSIFYILTPSCSNEDGSKLKPPSCGSHSWSSECDFDPSTIQVQIRPTVDGKWTAVETDGEQLRNAIGEPAIEDDSCCLKGRLKRSFRNNPLPKPTFFDSTHVLSCGSKLTIGNCCSGSYLHISSDKKIVQCISSVVTLDFVENAYSEETYQFKISCVDINKLRNETVTDRGRQILKKIDTCLCGKSIPSPGPKPIRHK